MPQEPKRDSSGKFSKDFSNQARLLKEIEQTQERINDLKENLIKGDKEQEKSIKSQIAYLNKLNKIYRQNTAQIKKQTENFDEMDDTMVSIGNQLKTNANLAEIISDKFKLTKDVSKAITLELSSGAVKNNKSKEQVLAVLDAYKKSQISIADINRKKALGNITEQERLSIINDVNDAFQTQLSLVDKTLISSEELLNVIDAMGKEADDFAEGIKKAQIKSELMDKTFDSFSGIPAMSEFNTLIKTNIKDTKAFQLALFALGATLAKSAYDYFGALDKIQRAAPYEAEKASIEGQIQATEALMFVGKTQATEDLKRKYEGIRVRDIESQKLTQLANAEMQIFEARWEAQNAGRRAAQSFNAEIAQAALSFRTASKTALFGDKLGGVGYGAAQLQMAGISAEKIAEQMSTAATQMGIMPSGKVAADMSIISERSGVSSEGIASMTNMFMKLDGASAQTALNLQEGMRAMADKAGISYGNLMQEVSEASKEMLGYQISSGKALAKQVAAAQSIGVSFNDIAKAGQNMVLNYKDSIKSEMQLSALLGRQVDLSEVRAKFAQGDTTGALEALKAQGLDPKQMDMFQQQALQQATGLDLASLQKIATENIRSGGELKEGAAGKENQSFLARTQSAQREQSIGSAQISANQAVLDAELSKEISKEYFKQISDITTPMGKEYKDLQIKQAEAEAEAAKVAAEKRMAIILDPGLQAFNARLAKIDIELNLMQTAIQGVIMALGGFAFSLGGTAVKNVIGKKFGSKLPTSTPTVPTTGASKGPSANVKSAAQIKAANPGMTSAQALQQARSAAQPAAASGGGFFSKMFSGAKNVGAKVMGSGAGKMLGSVSKFAKGIPILGNLLSVGSAISNLASGNYASAGLDALGMIPGLGTVLNVARASGLTSGLEDSLNSGAQSLLAGNKSKGQSPAAAATTDLAASAAPIKPTTTDANLKSSQVSANNISDKNAALGIQSAANMVAQLNVNKEQVSELGTMASILTSIKNNDDIRGKLMYGQDKLQTGYLAKSFTRHHTSMQVLETQLTIMKQTRDLQEIAVEFLAELLKKQEVSPKISLDGKVLNSKLFDRGQRDRIIA